MSSQEAPQVSKWIVAATVMIPTFIEVMDISVVNVSLPHIRGSLNAGPTEVTWVLTSYLVSNAIIIPITGWLSNRFGRKRYLLFSLTLFTAASVLSGSATTLEMLVLYRFLQGLGGGGLQPLSQAILMETFPREERGMAMALFGMGVVMAPTVGPVVGGWITDQISWRWVFFVNLPVGCLAFLMILFLIYDPPYIRRNILNIDVLGLFLLAVGLGSLQLVLDTGERNDWFSSDRIVVFTVLAAVSLSILIPVELRQKHPVVNLKAFRDRSFAIACTIAFAGFLTLFGSILMLPLFVQELMGYTAYLAGLVLGPGGIASFFIMPIAGVLMRRGVDAKKLLFVGLCIVIYSFWLMSRFDLEAGFWSIVWPRAVQGFGLGLFFVPLSTLAYETIPTEETGNASGIFNLLRNMGGSFGVALSATFFERKAQATQVYLSEHITPANPLFRDVYRQAEELLRSSNYSLETKTAALQMVYGQVLRQAHMIAYNETFLMLAVLTAVLLPIALFARGSGTAISDGPVL
jgi:DHA2 family multidrug resistance protein